ALAGLLDRQAWRPAHSIRAPATALDRLEGARPRHCDGRAHRRADGLRPVRQAPRRHEGEAARDADPAVQAHRRGGRRRHDAPREARNPLGRAVRADAGHLDAVSGDLETVGTAEPGEPRLQVALAELHHTVAALADEVMVVAAAAQAKARLAGTVRKRVDGAALRERGERPVDGREADAPALRAQAIVDLLGGCAVRLVAQCLEHGDALRRRAQAEAGEECAVALHSRHGVPYDSRCCERESFSSWWRRSRAGAAPRRNRARAWSRASTRSPSPRRPFATRRSTSRT